MGRDVTVLGFLSCKCSTFMLISLPFMSPIENQKAKVVPLLAGRESSQALLFILSIIIVIIIIIIVLSQETSTLSKLPSFILPFAEEIVVSKGPEERLSSPMPCKAHGETEAQSHGSIYPPLSQNSSLPLGFGSEGFPVHMKVRMLSATPSSFLLGGESLSEAEK